MNEIINFITQNGLYVFLVGIISSCILGIVKTLFRKRFIKGGEKSERDDRKENLFDTFIFLSSYVISFICSIAYNLIISKNFIFTEILKSWLPIWMAQSMVYGVWKKVGLKRLLMYLARLLVKDSDKDGKISLDEVILQVKDAVKGGKLDVNTLVRDITDNLETEFSEVLEEASKETEVTKEMEDTLKAYKGEPTYLVEDVKEAVDEIKESILDKKLETENNEVKVSIGPIIKI